MSRMRTSSKESLSEKVLTSHFGMAFSAHTYDHVWSLVTHQDGKVRLAVPRLAEANAARARLLTAR
jgi:hypothetical protein